MSFYTNAPEESTNAPEDATSAPESTTTSNPDTTTEPSKSQGCVGVVTGGLALVVLLGTAIILKKREC